MSQCSYPYYSPTAVLSLPGNTPPSPFQSSLSLLVLTWNISSTRSNYTSIAVPQLHACTALALPLSATWPSSCSSTSTILRKTSAAKSGSWFAIICVLPTLAGQAFQLGFDRRRITSVARTSWLVADGGRPEVRKRCHPVI